MPLEVLADTGTRRRRHRRWRGGIARWACCLLVAALAAGGQRSLADEQIVVIVHSENPVSTLTLHDLRLMYGLYRRVWTSGPQVRIVLPLPDTPVMGFLLHRVFRRMKSVVDLDRFYLEALFQQRIGKRPEQLSQRAALSFVRSVKGGVALIERSALPDSAGVRILEISEN